MFTGNYWNCAYQTLACSWEIFASRLQFCGISPALFSSLQHATIIYGFGVSFGGSAKELCRFTMSQRFPLRRHIANPWPLKVCLGISME